MPCSAALVLYFMITSLLVPCVGDHIQFQYFKSKWEPDVTIPGQIGKASPGLTSFILSRIDPESWRWLGKNLVSKDGKKKNLCGIKHCSLGTWKCCTTRGAHIKSLGMVVLEFWHQQVISFDLFRLVGESVTPWGMFSWGSGGSSYLSFGVLI